MPQTRCPHLGRQASIHFPGLNGGGIPPLMSKRGTIAVGSDISRENDKAGTEKKLHSKERHEPTLRDRGLFVSIEWLIAAAVGEQQQTALDRRNEIQSGINRPLKTHLRPERTPATGSPLIFWRLLHH
jgi:hypothetical protein